MIQLRNLADLKRATTTVGTPLHIENVRFPALTRDTTITKAHGQNIVTDLTRPDGTYVEHCYLRYGKASEWQFDGTATAKAVDDDGTVWITVTVLEAEPEQVAA